MEKVEIYLYDSRVEPFTSLYYEEGLVRDRIVKKEILTEEKYEKILYYLVKDMEYMEGRIK